MPACNCTGPLGRCRCQGGAALTYDTKVIVADTPAFKPEAPEDRLDRFNVKQLAEIMRERGIRGTGYQTPKAEKVARIADDIGDDTSALDEYETRYGINGG